LRRPVAGQPAAKRQAIFGDTAAALLEKSKESLLFVGS
jgi:hypothetical protein